MNNSKDNNGFVRSEKRINNQKKKTEKKFKL